MPIPTMPITVTILSVPEKIYKDNLNNPQLALANFYKMTSNDFSELHSLAIEIMGLDPKNRFDTEGLFYWVDQGSKNQAVNMGATQSWQFPANYKEILLQQAAANPKHLDMKYLYDWWVDSEDRRQHKIR